MKIELNKRELEIISTALDHYELICMKYFLKDIMKKVRKLNDKILKFQGVNK
jgi:hypothetical protein